MANELKTDLAFGDQFEPDVFWEKHGRKIVTGAAAVALLISLWVFWQRNQTKEAERASARLEAASDAAALQTLIRNYAGKPVAATAMLRLADIEFQKGRYHEASEVYRQFLSKFPRHPLKETAQLGLAAVQEAQGSFEEALSQYTQLVSLRPAGYVAMVARFGAARSAEALGRVSRARQLYEEIMAAGQGSSWETQAYLRWLALNQQQDNTATTNQPTPVTSTAPTTNTPVTVAQP